MQGDESTRSVIIQLLRNMGRPEEIQQYLNRFSHLDEKRFAIIWVGERASRATWIQW